MKRKRKNLKFTNVIDYFKIKLAIHIHIQTMKDLISNINQRVLKELCLNIPISLFVLLDISKYFFNI